MKLYEVAATRLAPKHRAWVAARTQGTFSLNTETGRVDVDGDVTLKQMDTEIVVPLGVVTGDFSCVNTQLATLKNAPTAIHGQFLAWNVPVTEPYSDRILGLFKLLKNIHIGSYVKIGGVADKVTWIVSRHMKDKDILACQEELIDAGYGRIARL